MGLLLADVGLRSLNLVGVSRVVGRGEETKGHDRLFGLLGLWFVLLLLLLFGFSLLGNTFRPIGPQGRALPGSIMKLGNSCRSIFVRLKGDNGVHKPAVTLSINTTLFNTTIVGAEVFESPSYLVSRVFFGFRSGRKSDTTNPNPFASSFLQLLFTVTLVLRA